MNIFRGWNSSVLSQLRFVFSSFFRQSPYSIAQVLRTLFNNFSCLTVIHKCLIAVYWKEIFPYFFLSLLLHRQYLFSVLIPFELVRHSLIQSLYRFLERNYCRYSAKTEAHQWAPDQNEWLNPVQTNRKVPYLATCISVIWFIDVHKGIRI